MTNICMTMHEQHLKRGELQKRQFDFLEPMHAKQHGQQPQPEHSGPFAMSASSQHQINIYGYWSQPCAPRAYSYAV